MRPTLRPIELDRCILNSPHKNVSNRGPLTWKLWNSGKVNGVSIKKLQAKVREIH